MAFPESHIVAPISTHTHTIIFLHGRDSDGEELAEQLFEGKTSTGKSIRDTPALSGYKWIFPSAHERLSTVFQEKLTEWFDVYSLTDTDAEQERQTDGIRESIEHTCAIIDQEAKHVPMKNIVLAGISQGFAIASHVLLSSQYSFAGLVGFCGWIPFQNKLQEVLDHNCTVSSLFMKRIGLQQSTDNPLPGTSIFIGHAKNDDVVDFRHGLDASLTLERFGMDVELHGYDGDQHWISEPQGHDDLAQFLTKLIR